MSKKPDAHEIRDQYMDGNGMSWTIGYGSVVGSLEPKVSPAEKELLRSLAQQVKQLSLESSQDEKRQLWTKHNSLEQTRPLIFCDPETAWYELIPASSLECVSPMARVWEFRLKKELYWVQRIKDDRVVTGEFTVQYVYGLSDRGLRSTIIGDRVSEAYAWEAPITDYALADKLRFSQYEVNYEKTQQILALAHDVFEGILDVRLEGVWWWSLCGTSELVMLRGLEQVMLDMYDNPDDLHRLMGFLRDETLKKLDFLEQNGLLSLNNGGDFIGTGGYGWCNELPRKNLCADKVHTLDMWGFCESQETVSVSPEFFDEFVFAYQLPVLERFGLNIYGCCEPLERRWDSIKRIPHLRKVTVSPWSNNSDMAEKIGSDHIFCKKVNPSYLATEQIDRAAVIQDIADAFYAAKRNNCPTQILLRDVVTLSHNPNNAIEWVKIAREQSEKIFG